VNSSAPERYVVPIPLLTTVWWTSSDMETRWIP